MKAYSMDLRQGVLEDSDAGWTTQQVADKYRVSTAWVRRFLYNSCSEFLLCGANVSARANGALSNPEAHVNFFTQLTLQVRTGRRRDSALKSWDDSITLACVRRYNRVEKKVQYQRNGSGFVNSR